MNAPVPGDMVVIVQKDSDHPIRARKQPNRLKFRAPVGDLQKEDTNVICEVPNESHGLYISGIRDTLKDALDGRSPGPFGYRPGEVIFHLVLWGERPVWISSADASVVKADAETW